MVVVVAVVIVCVCVCVCVCGVCGGGDGVWWCVQRVGPSNHCGSADGKGGVGESVVVLPAIGSCRVLPSLLAESASARRVGTCTCRAC